MPFMLSVNYTEYRKVAYYVQYRYAQYHYAECRGALPGPNVKFFTSVI
jgi:hypothetical protein